MQCIEISIANPASLRYSVRFVAVDFEGDRITGRWQFPELDNLALAQRLNRFYPQYSIVSLRWSGGK